MRNMSKTTCFSTTFILLVAAALHAEGRAFRMNASDLVSDGMHDYDQPENSYLYLKGSDDDSEKYCEQMYGFLPCSNIILGHLFLILVYEYLLFHGESYLAAGGEQVFKILGPGIFGASVFDILGALPESLILLVIGLSSDKESAQEYASTGVGLLSGSSILLLTVVWGTCVIVGKQKLENDPSDSSTSDPSSGKIKELLTGFVSFGVTIDPKTRKMANIMICSVMPLFIMQIPTLFRLSYTPRAVTLIIALIVAVVFLISYFIYQIFEPQIEKARLDYIKHHDTILRFFQLVEKQTLQRILNEDGTPNESAIEGLYNEIIRKEGKDIETSDIKEMLLQNTVTHEITENQIAEMLKIFDQNGDQIISRDEFVEGLKKYINQAKHAVDRKYLRTESLKNMYEGFIKPWIEHTRKEREFRNHVTSEVLKHVQSDMFRLSNDDGTPNESAIKRLFEELDADGNNKISKSELKKLVTNIHIVDTEKAVTKLIQDLDINRDNEVSEEEFVGVFTKWITTGSRSQAPHSTTVPHGNHQTWEDVEKVMITKQSKGVYAWSKALGHVVLGITMLSLLAEPLIASVQEFSEKAGISSFFISFILVPLATNFREATSAIREASHKKKGIISQTIYEIYGAVFMNNVLGFVVIAILIYMRDITWQFSADVLAVAIVCTVMGLTAMFRSTFPLWTSLPAYLLYIFSLVLVLVLKDVLNYV